MLRGNNFALRHPAIAFGAFILVFCTAAAAYAPNLRPDPQVDALLTRLSVRYGVPLPASFQAQPMSAADVIEFLDSVTFVAGSEGLSGAEARKVYLLRKKVKGRTNLFSWPRNDSSLVNFLNLSLLGNLTPAFADSTAWYARGIIGPRYSGAMGALSWTSEVDVWTEYDSDTLYHMSAYQPYEGIPYNLFDRAASGSLRSSDMLRAAISLDRGAVRLETGLDYLRTGPAVAYPLTLSGMTPPVTFFRGRLQLGGPEYWHSFGLLRSQKDKAKYFYHHRFQIPLARKRLTVAISEAVINGSTTEEQTPQNDPQNALPPGFYGVERDWEWLYMIPFVPYAFAEHYAGDRDNVVLSMDASLAIGMNWRGYGEFFLDDFTNPLTLFSDDWGNKWAFTMGIQYFGAVAGKDVHAMLEYSRVEPWVYTHFYGGSHRYTHYGMSLGSPLGPNADGLLLSVDVALVPEHELGVYLNHERKNADARGGSIRHVFQLDSDATTKRFLCPCNHDASVAGGVRWRYAPFALFSTETALEYSNQNGIALKVVGGFSF